MNFSILGIDVSLEIDAWRWNHWRIRQLRRLGLAPLAPQNSIWDPSTWRPVTFTPVIANLIYRSFESDMKFGQTIQVSSYPYVAVTKPMPTIGD